MKRLLQVCFIAAMVFGLASCDKNESGSSSGGSTASSLVGTQWEASSGNDDITLSFTSATNAEIIVNTSKGTLRYEATYTYSNGAGTLNLEDNGHPYTIEFTVSGNTLRANGTPAGDLVFTRVGGGSQPNPQPSGNLRNSVVGTSWGCVTNELFIGVGFISSNQVYIGVSPIRSDEESSYYGSYTYSNYSGTITARIDNQNYNITFTVNADGNTLTASNTPVGTVVMERITE